MCELKILIFLSKSKNKNIIIITIGIIYSSGTSSIDLIINGLVATRYSCSKTAVEIEKASFLKDIFLSNSPIKKVIAPSNIIAKITISEINL